MRRAILTVLATTVGLVLLLSFKPHEMNAAADRPALVGDASGSTGSAGGSGRAGKSHRAASGDEDSDDEGSGDDDGDGDGGSRTSSGGGGTTGSGGTSGGTGGGASISSGSWTGSGATAGATTGEKVVTGGTVDTRWGPVQVQIVVSGGKVTGVAVLQAPQGNRHDLMLNNQALPVLDHQALTAQSAQIDGVSGATYTSEGYISSLQSALDKAGI